MKYLILFTVIFSFLSCKSLLNVNLPKVAKFQDTKSADTFVGPIIISPYNEKEHGHLFQASMGYVTFTSDGENVTLYNITGLTGLLSLPYGNSSVSGAVCKIVDDNTIEAYDFIHTSENAVKFKTRITGKVVKKGIWLYTAKDDPIVIYQSATEGGEEVPVLEIKFRGELITFL